MGGERAIVCVRWFVFVAENSYGWRGRVELVGCRMRLIFGLGCRGGGGKTFQICRRERKTLRFSLTSEMIHCSFLCRLAKKFRVVVPAGESRYLLWGWAELFQFPMGFTGLGISALIWHLWYAFGFRSGGSGSLERTLWKKRSTLTNGGSRRKHWKLLSKM